MVVCPMPRTGRPKAVLALADDERAQLVRWERRRKSSQALALRSRIVLACAEGRSNTDVAAACGVAPTTVGKWRRRSCELRLDGLVDEPWPGRPATTSVERVEGVVVATLESTPEHATHWSRAKTAERSGSFTLSPDPMCGEKVYAPVSGPARERGRAVRGREGAPRGAVGFERGERP